MSNFKIATPEEIQLKLDFTKKIEDAFGTKDFVFEEVEHKYTLKGVELVSATTFIKRFSEQFDKEDKAMKFAGKHGLVYEQVLEDWEEKGRIGRELGTNVHKFLEDFWGQNDHVPHADPAVQDRIKDYLRFHEHNMMDKIPVLQECRVFHKEWGICGTFDNIFLVKNMLDEYEFQIWDWKTNKDEKFTTDADFNYNKFLYKPFTHLKDNEHNKYSIQVSLYKLILAEFGIKIGKCFLCHIPPSGNVKIHEVKDLTKELKYYLNGVQYMPANRDSDDLFA